jgi:DNA-binding transcriptional LysR family regulator
MIDKLEYLLALAQAQHFGRAAEACGITQPTLSAGLKQLEETLGVLLVNRGSRFQGFTPEGGRVLEWARRVVGDVRAMRDEVRALKQGLGGHLRIAAIPTALPMVASLTTPYRAGHPDVSFTILSRTSSQVLDLLENLEADAGLTYLDNEPVGRVRAIPLYRERSCLIVSDDHDFAARESVTWAEAGSVPLCLLTPDMQNRRIIDRCLRAANVAPNAALESNSMIVLLTHVQTRRWATVLPAAMAEALGQGHGLRLIPVTGEEPPTIGLVYPKREPLSPQTAALVAEARKLAAEFGMPSS